MKKIPKFKNKEAEKKFWLKNDSSNFINWSKSQKNPYLINLKPSTKTISIRLPEDMLNSLKMKANKRDMPYQSLVKFILSKEIKKL